MARRSFMFTSKSHSEKGMFASGLGVISLISILLCVYLSYKQGGEMDPKLGAAAFFALLIAIGGLTMGIIARREKDVFYLFPDLGIALNTISFLIILALYYLGI